VRAEKVYAADVFEAFLEFGDVGGGSGAGFEQSAGRLREIVIIGVAGGVEKGANFGIRLAREEAGFGKDGFAAAAGDFFEQGSEGGFGIVRMGEDVDGVLEGDCADGLEATPDLYAQIGGLGGELVEEG
jgi:hypothetical protein